MCVCVWRERERFFERERKPKLDGFYDISIDMGYLMPNHVYTNLYIKYIIC